VRSGGAVCVRAESRALATGDELSVDGEK